MRHNGFGYGSSGTSESKGTTEISKPTDIGSAYKTSDTYSAKDNPFENINKPAENSSYSTGDSYSAKNNPFETVNKPAEGKKAEADSEQFSEKSTDKQKENEKTGRYVAEVTYTAESGQDNAISDAETYQKMQEAYNETSDKEDMNELRDRIEDKTGIELTSAEVIERPEDKEVSIISEQSEKLPSEAEPAKTMEKAAEAMEKSVPAKENPTVRETDENNASAPEKKVPSTKELAERSAETEHSARQLMQEYENAESSRTSPEQLSERNSGAMDELVDIKQKLNSAMLDKYSELRDYVTSSDIDANDLENDENYRRVIQELNALDASRTKLDYAFASLDTNNRLIAENNGTHYTSRYAEIHKREDELRAKITESNDDGDSGDVKVLGRAEVDLLATGKRNIDDILSVKADDYIDKGYDELTIAEKLEQDKIQLRRDFLNDAFPEQELPQEIFDELERGTLDVNKWFGKDEGTESYDAPEESAFLRNIEQMEFPPEYKELLKEKFESMDPEIRVEYEKYADRLRYVPLYENGELSNKAYFSPAAGGFTFNPELDNPHPIGAGYTFFHESGHMIDWLKGHDADEAYASHIAEMTDSIQEDYEYNIERIMYEHGCSKDMANLYLSRELLSAGHTSHCVSDVFGGISFGAVQGSYAHSNLYWLQRDRNAIGREAFAEITGDMACGNTEMLEFTRKYMPRTMEAYSRAINIGGKTK